jgi:hypothetical protein
MFLRALVMAVCFGLAVAPAASAARVRARFPGVVVVGARVVVHGAVVSGRRDGGLRVAVQRRSVGRWLSVGPARRVGRFRFRFVWRAPRRPGVVRLRVALLRSGRVVAASRARRVAVSATHVLSSGRLKDAPAPGRGGVLRYAGRVSVPVGSFVAADVGPATPFGLLGRVTAVRQVGGSTLVSITPATLVEAVPAGSLTMTPATAAARRPARAFRRRPSAAPASRAPARGFRSALSCSSGVAAELDGSLSVRLIPSLELSWSLEGIDRAEAKATIRGDAELTATLTGTGACELPETSVARWDAPPLRFFAGPIPVVVVPRTNLFVAADASASAGVAIGLRGHVAATAGLSYDGDVHPIGSFSYAFSHTAPAQRVTGRLGAHLIPAITFLLYGQAGPRFDLSTGLELNAEANGDPWWTLTAPVELRAGLDVPGLDDLAIPQQTVFSKTFQIAHAPTAGTAPSGAGTAGGSGAPNGGTPGGGTAGGGGAPSDPGAAPSAGPGDERARITWDTAATDVDLHVWDAGGNHAWFRDPTGIPGAELAEDDRYGFGPEHFREHSPTGRVLTYGLCYFDDTGAGPTNVAVHLTDPGGGTRDFTRTLAREGDHLLVGSSPAGSAFVPPDGWCRP